MKNPYVFVLVIVLVVALETLGLYLVGAWIGRLAGTKPTSVWVCLAFVLFGNFLWGKYIHNKNKKKP